MGHVWTWLESKGDFLTESEKSSYCQSSQDSSDSSLDLELSSWRETKETTEVEESSSEEEEEETQLDRDDFAPWAKDSKGELEEPGRYKEEGVLRFLSEVTDLMEPLCIGSRNLEPDPLGFSSSGEQNGRTVSPHKEDIKGILVHKEEEAEENYSQILNKEAKGGSVSQRREKWAFQFSEELSVIHWETEGMEEFQGSYKEAGDSQMQGSKLEGVTGEKVLKILEKSVRKTEEEDEDCSPELLVQIPCNWRTGSKEIPLSEKQQEVAIENTEESTEDWKNSDFHLSYTSDDSSPWGTHLSSPSTSSASLPLMQLNQNESLQQHLLFKKTLLSIWKMVAGHRYSGPFLKAVSEKQAPGYRDVVKRPVDLSSIKRSISKGQIQNMVQFQRDLMLMFQNAIMYNNSNHHIHHIAVEMEQEVLEQLQMLGEALLCTEEMQDFVRRC